MSSSSVDFLTSTPVQITVHCIRLPINDINLQIFRSHREENPLVAYVHQSRRPPAFQAVMASLHQSSSPSLKRCWRPARRTDSGVSSSLPCTVSPSYVNLKVAILEMRYQDVLAHNDTGGRPRSMFNRCYIVAAREIYTWNPQKVDCSYRSYFKYFTEAAWSLRLEPNALYRDYSIYGQTIWARYIQTHYDPERRHWALSLVLHQVILAGLDQT